MAEVNPPEDKDDGPGYVPLRAETLAEVSTPRWTYTFEDMQRYVTELRGTIETVRRALVGQAGADHQRQIESDVQTCLQVLDTI